MLDTFLRKLDSFSHFPPLIKDFTCLIPHQASVRVHLPPSYLPKWFIPQLDVTSSSMHERDTPRQINSKWNHKLWGCRVPLIMHPLLNICSKITNIDTKSYHNNKFTSMQPLINSLAWDLSTLGTMTLILTHRSLDSWISNLALIPILRTTSNLRER